MRGSLLGVVLLAGAASAKPPGLPADPRPDGREADPVERLFHESKSRPTPLGVAEERPRADGGWWRLLSVPLGLARAGDWM